MADTLDDAAVADRLRDLPAWTRHGDEIRREVKAPSFPEGIAVVDEVARAAEDADHHPDIDIRWRRLAFVCSTHSAGNRVTELDVELATRIDGILADLGGTAG